MRILVNLKNKLLLILLIVSLAMAIQATDNSEEDKQWAIDLANGSRDAVWQDLKQKFLEQESLEGQGAEQARQRKDGLYIFVSSSMPRQLLKSYVKQANIYSGTLVFKGLPNSSFKELAKLIQEITPDDAIDAAMQIDDEMFERFNITQVPTIMMLNEGEYIPNQTARIVYDQIIGNVGIKYALEQFVEQGDLANKALEHLSVEQ